MKINVCIATFPLGGADLTPLSNSVKLFSRLVNRLESLYEELVSR